jgi:hypothetical protein
MGMGDILRKALDMPTANDDEVLSELCRRSLNLPTTANDDPTAVALRESLRSNSSAANSQKAFTDAVAAVVASEKISYADACKKVASSSRSFTGKAAKQVS